MTRSEAEKITSRSSSVFHSRSLRPVSAKIVAYGREYQSHRRPTLYVLRVSRSGIADWYVAKRYSEFRALHHALQRQCSGSGSKQHRGCSACEELESFYSCVCFPTRHVFQSGLGFSKKRLDASRMKELDSYMRFLLETTQGLLGDEENEAEWPKRDGSDSSQCLALALIRDFLMVSEDHTTDASTREDGGTYDRKIGSRVLSAATTRRQQHRVTRRSSSVTRFRACELDLVPTEKSLSPDELMRNVVAESYWDLTIADLFDERTAPPEDALIHRQVEDALARTRP